MASIVRLGIRAIRIRPRLASLRNGTGTLRMKWPSAPICWPSRRHWPDRTEMATRQKETSSGRAGRLPPDWVQIYKDYRLGVLSIRHIARSRDITEGAIRKRAKREGWERDLGDIVRRLAREMLLKEDAE